MDFYELKQSLKEKILPAYIIHGQDLFLKNNALSQLKQKIQNPESNISAYADDFVAALKNLETYPLFSDYRLVIVLNPKKSADALINYLERPNSTSILAVVFDNTEPSKALLKKAEEVVCNKLDERFIKTYIAGFAEKSNVSFSGQAVAALIEYGQGDMAYISKEAEKLIAYAGEYGTVTEAMVETTSEPVIDYKLYELTDALGRRNKDKSFKTLDNLIANKVEPTVILSSLYTHFRRLLHLSLTETELYNILGIKPYAEKMMRQQAKNFSQMSLKRITDTLSDNEYRIKSGQINQSDALNLSIMKIINS